MKTFKKYMNEKKSNVRVFYHLDMDGYGAAYAAWKVLGESAKYFKVNYGYKLNVDKGDTVYMVDFSVKRPEILKMCEKAEKVIIIDHHITAKKELIWKGAPDNLEVTFDEKKSGAVLAWEYFHPGKKMPAIFHNIQDYDLWKFKVPHSKATALWFDKNVWKKGFKEFDKLPPLKKIHREGELLVDEQDKQVQKSLKKAYEVSFEGHLVGVVDEKESTNANEIGNALAKKYTFGVVVSYDKKDPNMKKYNLRSIGNFDVSKVAAKYGGGGHKNASGFLQQKDKKIWKKT